MIANGSITIKQVAQQAGVSTQTVSRVINNRPDVAYETRQKVQQVIADMGYSPNAIARSLSQGRTHCLGVVVHGLTYYGRAHALTGIERQANLLGYSLQLVLMNDPVLESPTGIFRSLAARQVDGILWAVPEIGSNHAWLDEPGGLPLPVVFLNMQPRAGIDSVEVNNRQGGYLATRHLLSHGCRSIGIVTGPMDWWESRERFAGWQQALEEYGIWPDPAMSIAGDWSAASGDAGLVKLVAANPRLQAVFASNDQMALGVLQAARRLGRAVPGDLAVVGFDDIPEALYFYPPLTTIRQDLAALGEHAIRLLHQRIEEREKRTGSPAQPEWVEPELIERISSQWEGANPAGEPS